MATRPGPTHVTYDYDADIDAAVRATHESFIEQMQSKMDEDGIKRMGLADITGNSASMLSRTFTARDNITIKTMVRNAMAVGCDVEIRLVGRDS